jgi:hypothetical protein
MRSARTTMLTLCTDEDTESEIEGSHLFSILSTKAWGSYETSVCKPREL